MVGTGSAIAVGSKELDGFTDGVVEVVVEAGVVLAGVIVVELDGVVVVELDGVVEVDAGLVEVDPEVDESEVDDDVAGATLLVVEVDAFGASTGVVA